MDISRDDYARLTGRIYELDEARSLQKGNYPLGDGSAVTVKRTGSGVQILVYPKDFYMRKTVPTHAEDSELIKGASKVLGLDLRWVGQWSRTKMGYAREVQPTEKVVAARSHAVGKWLDDAIMQLIKGDADAMDSPSLSPWAMKWTAATILDHLPDGPQDWQDLGKKEQRGRVQDALKRLTKKGSLELVPGKPFKTYKPV